jgi:uncharacterized OB-fold protein
MVSSSSQSKPIISGLFTWPSTNPQLIATHCTSCNTYYFPNKKTCNNPNCKEKKVEEALLSKKGKLWSFTLMQYPPSHPFKSDRKPPYPVGVVELPEGIRILGLLTDCEYEKLAIGMDMELVFEPLHTAEDGAAVVTWMFKPIKK